jgi:hypothetical protein
LLVLYIVQLLLYDNSEDTRTECERNEILTSSPYKIAVEEKENKNNSKEENNRLKTDDIAPIEEEGDQIKGSKAKIKSGDKEKQTQRQRRRES